MRAWCLHVHGGCDGGGTRELGRTGAEVHSLYVRDCYAVCALLDAQVLSSSASVAELLIKDGFCLFFLRFCHRRHLWLDSSVLGLEGGVQCGRCRRLDRLLSRVDHNAARLVEVLSVSLSQPALTLICGLYSLLLPAHRFPFLLFSS